MKTDKNTIIEIEKNYEIFTDGRVYSKKSKKWLKPTIGWSHEVYYHLGSPNISIGMGRLVALKYIPNPMGYSDVEHLDGNIMNNDISNLGWCKRAKNFYKNKEDKEWRERDVITTELSSMLNNDARSKRVRVNGVVYDSIGDACLSLGIDRRKFNRKWDILGVEVIFD